MIKKDLGKLLKPADVLLIIPPFFLKNQQSLAAHILQACGREAGFNIQLFYANLHFASLMGIDYSHLCHINYFLLGERIFARKAYGNRIYNGIFDEVYEYSRILGKKRAAQLKVPIQFFPPDDTISIERLYQIETIAFQWVEDVSRILTGLHYPVVACTASYEQINASIALLKTIKSHNPAISTLIGGYNCEGECAEGIASLDPDKKIIDYIFSGECESVFVEFLSGYKKNKFYNRIITGTPHRDLDDLPELDYSQYFKQLYYFFSTFRDKQDEISLSYETSRGCWWGEKNPCLFCGYNQNQFKFRQKSAARIITDLKAMKKYHINTVQVSDLSMPLNYLNTLFPRIKNNNEINYQISYGQRANLNYRDMKVLKDTGIIIMQPGIETFSLYLLDCIGKGTTPLAKYPLFKVCFCSWHPTLLESTLGFPPGKYY